MKRLPYIMLIFAAVVLLAAGMDSAAQVGKNGRPESSVAVEEADNSMPIAADDTVWAEDEPNNAVMKAFTLIPDKDLDIILPQMREQMIIYMQADSIYKCRNVYSGLSWIEVMTPNYLRVHLTDVSSLQLKILSSSSKGKHPTDLVMSIYTISGESDTADSTVKFYQLTDWGNDSTSLSPLDARKYLRLPAPEDFFDKEKIKASGLKLSDLMEEIPFHTIAYRISEAEPDELTGSVTHDNYLTLEQRARIEPYLRKTLRWIWNGKKFQLVRP